MQIFFTLSFLLLASLTYGQIGPYSQPVPPARYVPPMDLNLYREGLIYKQQQAERQQQMAQEYLRQKQYEAEQQKIEEREKYYRQRNQVMSWYNSQSNRPIPQNGWHKVWMFTEEDFNYGQRQVYVENGMITQYYKNEKTSFIVDYSSSISNGYARITIHLSNESSTDASIKEIFFLK